jgi:hypothetical protein
MLHFRSVRVTCIAGALVLCIGRAAIGGEIHINMYSLPGKGVEIRNDVAIRVRAFGVQTNTDTTPLMIGSNELAIRPRGSDVNGNVSTGIAIFDIPDRLFDEAGLTNNLPISFQFEIENTVVQAVLGTVVPRNGSVDLNVTVPDPTQSVCSPPVVWYHCCNRPRWGWRVRRCR